VLLALLVLKEKIAGWQNMGILLALIAILLIAL
jgi:EamA domain-containing membrane protein RarD